LIKRDLGRKSGNVLFSFTSVFTTQTSCLKLYVTVMTYMMHVLMVSYHTKYTDVMCNAYFTDVVSHKKQMLCMSLISVCAFGCRLSNMFITV